jgi:hypothetical protein
VLAVFLLCGGLLCGAAPLVAEEAQPAEQPLQPGLKPAECNPQTTVCYAVESWVIGLRHWTPDAKPRDIAGGRGQFEARFKRWRVQGRIDGTATAGEYRSNDLATVRDVEAHAAGIFDFVRLPGDVSLGGMVALGGAVTLPAEGGVRATLGRPYTAVVGLAGAWKGGGRIHLGVGAVHPLDRGLGLVATWQLPITARTMNVGMLTVGRRTVSDSFGSDGVFVPAHSEGTVLVWTGAAVRFP